MKKIHYIIIESDLSTQFELREVLDTDSQFQCDAVFETSFEATEYLGGNDTDVVFMNYKIGDPKKTGDAFYLCYYWNQVYPDRMTVLYGDNPTMAIRSLEFYAIDYFSLPVEFGSLQRVMNKIRYQKDLLDYKVQAKNRLIMIKTKQGFQIIERNQILFVERINRKNRMVTTNGEEIWLANYNMDELESLLSEYGFYRCYQSYIVNLEKVVEIRVNSEKNLHTLRFENFDEEIILSRTRYAEVMKILREKYASVYL
ncbi:MAG: LytTR family DNA-binding domain-containing protein [Lachnospiraceae bacterium]|nr:LytTR family DNA-binding domain-containing protein [Lachnospiraceae bacterium]